MSKTRYYLDTEFIEAPGVLDLISIGIVCEDGREYYAVSCEFDRSRASQWVVDNVLPHLPPHGAWKSRATIAQEILAFVGATVPEFWAYYADYDWVAFCWLFGCMVDLPRRWPMFCMDLRQSMIERKIVKDALPVQEGTEHHALADARWVRDACRAVLDHREDDGR